VTDNSLEKAKDTTLDALSRITLIHRVALVPVLLYFSGCSMMEVTSVILRIYFAHRFYIGNTCT